MSPVVFEPEFPASERPKTHALDRAATGTGPLYSEQRISGPQKNKNKKLYQKQ